MPECSLAQRPQEQIRGEQLDMASAFGDPMAPFPCEECGNTTEGTMRCSVRDSKNLCQDCFQDLPQARQEDIGDPEWVCHFHLTHKVDIFCETCQLGCCKECAADVHKGHNVKNVFRLVEEIRRDLTEQLQEVGVRAEGLSELRRKIESSLGKIEEAPKLVDEFKKEAAQYLEKEVHRINEETEMRIIHLERRRDNMLKLVKEKVDLGIKRIQENQHGLLEDAERRKCKIQKAESKLLVAQRACERANLEITSMLESTPEKLVCRGRQLGSLVKASSAFQCQNDVLKCCREVEADLPELKVDKDVFFNGVRLCSPLVKIMLYIFGVGLFYFANEAPGDYRDEYNRMLSSESMTSLIMLCSYFPMCHAMRCFVLTLLLACGMYDYPITRRESFMKKLKSCIKIVPLAIDVWLLTVLFLTLVNSPLYLFQVKSVGAKIVSIISILQSCSFLYGMRNLKAFKDYCDYQMLY